VVFDFQMSRGRDGRKRFLGSFAGLLQTDAYIAYEKVGGPQLVHAGCWTHYLASAVIQGSHGNVLDEAC
jgi:hypothetical protein